MCSNGNLIGWNLNLLLCILKKSSNTVLPGEGTGRQDGRLFAAGWMRNLFSGGNGRSLVPACPFRHLDSRDPVHGSFCDYPLAPVSNKSICVAGCTFRSLVVSSSYHDFSIAHPRDGVHIEYESHLTCLGVSYPVCTVLTFRDLSHRGGGFLEAPMNSSLGSL